MIVRRIAAPTTALFVTLTLVAGAGPALAARGESSEDRDRRDKEAEAAEEEVNPCPEELWTLAVPVDGLACVLLVPKEDKADKGDAQKSGDEEKKNRRRN